MTSELPITAYTADFNFNWVKLSEIARRNLKQSNELIHKHSIKRNRKISQLKIRCVHFIAHMYNSIKRKLNFFIYIFHQNHVWMSVSWIDLGITLHQ